MSLQANQYLVYLGREEEKQVSRDYDDHQHYSHRPPRPPPMHYSGSAHRSDSTHFTPNLPQHVPNSTPLAQSTPRSLPHVPSTTTTVTSMETQRSRHAQHHTLASTPNRLFARRRCHRRCTFTDEASRSRSISRPSSVVDTICTIVPFRRHAFVCSLCRHAQHGYISSEPDDSSSTSASIASDVENVAVRRTRSSPIIDNHQDPVDSFQSTTASSTT